MQAAIYRVRELCRCDQLQMLTECHIVVYSRSAAILISGTDRVQMPEPEIADGGSLVPYELIVPLGESGADDSRRKKSDVGIP